MQLRIVALFFLLLFAPLSVFAAAEYYGRDIIYLYEDTLNQGIPRATIYNFTRQAMGSEQNLTVSAPSAGSYIEGCDVPNKNQTLVSQYNNGSSYMINMVLNGASGITGNLNYTNTLLWNSLATRHKPVVCGAEEYGGRGFIVASNGSGSPQTSFTIWNGSAWNTSSTNPTGTTELLFGELVSRTGTSEVVLVGFTTLNQSFLSFWNATSQTFNNVKNLSAINAYGTDPGAGAHTRFYPLACAYESVSGNLICFHRNITMNVNLIEVIEFNTSGYGSEIQRTTFNYSGLNQTNISFFKAWNNPINDEILVMASELNTTASSQKNISVFVWNGTNITNWLGGIETQAVLSLGTANYMVYDAAYQYQTTNKTATLAVYCWINNVGNGVPNCRTWNGTVHSAEINANDVTGASSQVTGVSMSSYINGLAFGTNSWAVLATSDADGDLNVQLFNTTAWTNPTEIETALNVNSQRWGSLALWTRYDTTIPNYAYAAQNATSINNGTSIYLNASVRDNFQIDTAWLETNETGAWVNYTSDVTRSKKYVVKAAYWQDFNVTWSNNSITTNTTVGWRFWVNDTNGNLVSTGLQSFNITSTAAGGPGDTCTYSGSGNWAITASDFCYITTAYDLQRNNITCTGTGYFTVNARVANVSRVITTGSSCYAKTNGTGRITSNP
jgi:hypothetical protein